MQLSSKVHGFTVFINTAHSIYSYKINKRDSWLMIKSVISTSELDVNLKYLMLDTFILKLLCASLSASEYFQYIFNV